MQRARARLRGDHAQHVGRDVERGEGEQPRWHAGRQRAVGRAEAGEVIVEASRAVVAACGDAAPQFGLRIARLLSGLPGQQPVASPGLVLLEDAGELARQRPRLERVVAREVLAQWREGAAGQRRWLGQLRVQPPLQGRRVAGPRWRRARWRRARRARTRRGSGSAGWRRCRGVAPASTAASAASRPAGSAPCPASAAAGRARARAAAPRAARPARPGHWNGRDGSRGGRASRLSCRSAVAFAETHLLRDLVPDMQCTVAGP